MSIEGLRKWVAPERIRAVFLDVGNTLVFLDFEAIAETMRQSDFSVEVSRLEQAEYRARRRADSRYMEGDTLDIEFLDNDSWDIYIEKTKSSPDHFIQTYTLIVKDSDF